MQTNEEQLVRQAQRGDARAFNELVILHQRFVYNLALRGVGNAQDAEDIAQEAFLRAWIGLPRFRGRSSFRTWLYRIAVNLCYDRLPRLRQQYSALSMAEMESLPDSKNQNPVDAAEAGERRGFLHRQIAHLPESYQLILMLRYQQGLSYEEIAQIMEMPLGTVKTCLHRAHRHLREALNEFEEELV